MGNLWRIRVCIACLFVLVAWITSGGCAPAASDSEAVGQAHGAIVNGTTDANDAYGAVAYIYRDGDPAVGLCSGTLIAPRVVLTAAHCVTSWLLCGNFTNLQLSVAFPPPKGANPGGFATVAEVAARRVAVQDLRSPPSALSVTSKQCPAFCELGAGNPVAALNQNVDIALLLLKTDAPPDVKPMALMVDAQAAASVFAASPGAYAGTFGWFTGLGDWVELAGAIKRKISVVGYGNGSAEYPLAGTTDSLRARTFGVTSWIHAASLPQYGVQPDCVTPTDSLFAAPSVVFGATDLAAGDFAGLPNGACTDPLPAPALVPGKKQSAPSFGDSGGPALVGPGVASHGLAPSTLPSPLNASDSYDPQRQYVVGVSSHLYGESSPGAGDQCLFGEYAATFLGDTTTFLVGSLHDADHDGYPDVVDRCANFDDHLDTDHDGMPNACDPCPCDPQVFDKDPDGDGVCAKPCPGEPRDNCPNAPNVLQANCNLLSEQAHPPPGPGVTIAEAIRGDACDSAICPSSVPVSIPADPNTFTLVPCPHIGPTPEDSCSAPPPDVKTFLYCGSFFRNSHGLRPLASHDQFGAFTASPDAVSTSARYCQRSADRSCIDLTTDIQDVRLDEGGTVTNSSQETLQTHFLRVEQLFGAQNIGPDQSPPDLAYLWDVPEGTSPAAKLPPMSATWQYTVDWQRWFNAGVIDKNAVTAPNLLAGTFWRHAAKPYGATIDIGRGTRVAELNNAHVAGYALTGYAPEDHEKCTACVILKSLAASLANQGNAPNGGAAAPQAPPPPPPPDTTPYLIWRPSVRETPGDFVRVEQQPLEAHVVLPVGGGLYATAGGNCGPNGGQLVTEKLGPKAVVALQMPAVWANAVEPLADIGAGPTFPVAVALSTDGSQLVNAVRSTGATLAATGDGPTCAPPVAPAAPTFLRAFGSFGSGPGQLSSPVGVGVDAASNTYVTDRDNHRVCTFDPNGAFRFCWGNSGSADGEFGGVGATGYGPYGLEVDKGTGVVCVADTINARVQCFDGSGAFLFKFGSFGVGPGEFAAEMGIGFDPRTHDIYVADTFAHRVQVFDPAGNYLRQWGAFGSAPGQLAYPRDVAVDERGNVYVAEYDNNRISKFDRLGNFLATWGSFGTDPGKFRNPHGVAVDTAGLVYVADVNNSRVQVFAPDGALVTLWGGQGTAPGQFQGAIGVALDVAGDVFVSDHFGNRVEVFGPLTDGCAVCPSGQCVRDRPGACCERACSSNDDCPSAYCSPTLHVCAARPSTGSPHAVGFVAVPSRARRGVFVVGGRNPSTNQPTGEVWFSSIDGGDWSRVSSPGYAMGNVLAATYSYTTRKLYVLDEPAAGQARLAELAVDGGRGGAHTIAVVARDASWNKIYLVPDLDGGLLIASSSAKKKKHVIARLNVNVSPPKLEALEVGNREFIVPPVVDGSGYTLLLRKDQGNDKIRRERLKSLTLKVGNIQELGTGL